MNFPKILSFLLIPVSLTAQNPITPHSVVHSHQVTTSASKNPLAQKRQQRTVHTGTQNNSQDNKAIIREIQHMKSTEIQYEFPSKSHLRGTKRYYTTYDQLVAMLQEHLPLSIKDAVFLVEQAYSGETLQKSWYDTEIEKSVSIIQDAMKSVGYEQDNELGKKMLLHAFMSGTLEIRDNEDKVVGSTNAKKYDFEDINGQEDWTKMFVTKLMRTNTGQCHSLPLLYLILAEQLQIEAYLAFSPEHSYVKMKDNNGSWVNLELTNGHYSTDQWLLSSGYVNAEAIQSGIYMKPKSKKETIAYCLVDLAMGYANKYGTDAFVLRCVDKALEYDSKNITAWQIKTNYYTYLFDYVAKQMGYPKSLDQNQYPQFHDLYTKRNELYKHIDRLGYNYMPEETYKTWLQTLEQRKDLQQKIIRP